MKESVTGIRYTGPYPDTPYPVPDMPPGYREEDSISEVRSYTSNMPRSGVHVEQIAERFDHRGAPTPEDVADFRSGARRPRRSRDDDGEDDIPHFYKDSRSKKGDPDNFLAEFRQYYEEFNNTGMLPYAEYNDPRDNNKLATKISRSLAFL